MTDLEGLKKAIVSEVPNCENYSIHDQVYEWAFLEQLIQHTDKFIPPDVFRKLFQHHLICDTTNIDLSYFED